MVETWGPSSRASSSAGNFNGERETTLRGFVFRMENELRRNDISLPLRLFDLQRKTNREEEEEDWNESRHQF